MKKLMFDDGENCFEVADEEMLYDKIVGNFYEFCKDGGALLSYWEDDIKTRSLRIGAVKNYGVCLTHDIYYKKMSRIGEITTEHTHLAVYDKTKLEEVIDVYDEIYASVGLFFPPEIAWKGIKKFMASGGMSLDIEWILAESIPENGNWC